MRICPFCSTENEAFFRFCLGCGADLDEALGVGDDAAVVAPAPVLAQAPEPKKKPPEPPPTETKKKVEPPPPLIAEAEMPDDVVQVPKPRVSSKDTAVDMPAVTPEMLDKMKARGGKAPSATPGSPPPRVSREREKTIEPGGAVRSGSAASQAVAQAQSDGARRQSTVATEQVGAGPAVASRQRAKSEPAIAKAEPAKAPSFKVDRGGEHDDAQTKPQPVSNTNPRPQAGPPPASPPTSRETRTQAAVPDTTTRRAGSPEGIVAPSPKRPGGKTKARLVIILEDGTDGSTLDLSPETTVLGREGVDISFPHDDFLAKRHAELTFSDGVLYLRPLTSTNGVFLQVHQEVELENGDVFRIGQQLLCFEMLSMVAATLTVDPKGQAIPLGSPVPEGAWGRLGQLIAPETLGSVYLLGGNEVYLGRERGDITFPGDGFVSGLHAQISMRNGRCFLKDLGSSNGTYLRLSKATPVRRGMLVLAGQQLFRVES